MKKQNNHSLFRIFLVSMLIAGLVWSAQPPSSVSAAAASWTWMSGSNVINQGGVYGTKGTSDAANVPGARQNSMSWVDGAGNLWLFGGNGNASDVSIGTLNDLWRYNLASGQWTWVSGSNTIGQAGVYGTQGTPDAANIPGARESGFTWMDGAGNLWLLGGSGSDSAGSNGVLNDLWRYNIASGQWTWMSGSTTKNPTGVYGTKGTPDAANVPGARNGGFSWVDGAGNLWLFGGTYITPGFPFATTNFTNDLWRYNIASGQWTWMSGANTPYEPGTYGTRGTSDAANVPGARSSGVSWVDGAGSLWLLGGLVFNGADISTGDDLWRYSLASGQWTWMNGSDVLDETGVYGVKGTPNANNFPGGRYLSVGWNDNAGNLWLFGGDKIGGSKFNDLWRYNLSSGNWTWMGGSDTTDQVGAYGTKGTVDAANMPGGRDMGVSWVDGAGNLWLFGGFGYGSGVTVGRLNDLWRYGLPSPNQSSTWNWTWMSGPNTNNQNGVYGTKGTPDAANFPGSRLGSVTWTDSAGNLWLFGGLGYDSGGTNGYLNDLWRYQIVSGQWIWIGGSNLANGTGVYGTKGTADAANIPGGRDYSLSWTDSAGNLWLFGGLGYGSIGANGYLNDLWRYNIASGQWTWMSGADTVTQSAVYGTQGTPDPANVPGSRYLGVSWSDRAGNLWLFGGGNTSAYWNDLWRYNVASGQWTWMSGSSTGNSIGVYGVQGTPDAANVPGARRGSISWNDASGNFWLFGGYGYDSISGGASYLNDLWFYNVASGNWTWMSGSDTGNALGVYGTQGSPDPNNVPGARRYSLSWADGAGNLWLFGGRGYTTAAPAGYLADLWRYQIVSGQWTWMGGSSTVDQGGVYGTLGTPAPSNQPGARQYSTAWTDSTGVLWLLGGQGYDSVATYGFMGDLWRLKLTGLIDPSSIKLVSLQTITRPASPDQLLLSIGILLVLAMITGSMTILVLRRKSLRR